MTNLTRAARITTEVLSEGRWTAKSKSDYFELAKSKRIIWLGPLLPKKVEDKTSWQCSCGNIYFASYKRVRASASYCICCSPSRPKTEDDYHGLAQQKGIDWISENLPKNTKTKTSWACLMNRHKWEATYNSISLSPRSGCRQCFNNRNGGKDNPNWQGGGGRAGAAHRRRAREAGVINTFTECDWQTAFDYWEGKCAYCGSLGDTSRRQQLTQDHFFPLNLGGDYSPNNIVPACLSCNSSKRDRLPLDWLVYQFGDRGYATYERIRDWLQHGERRGDHLLQLPVSVRGY